MNNENNGFGMPNNQPINNENENGNGGPVVNPNLSAAGLESVPFNPELPVDEQNLTPPAPVEPIVTEPMINQNIPTEPMMNQEIPNEPVMNQEIPTEPINNNNNSYNATPIDNMAFNANPIQEPATSIDMSGFTNPNPPVMDSNFGNVNSDIKQEVVGQMPPENNGKKPFNKILFVILMLVLIGGVAFGIYYYLSLPKNNPSVQNVVPKKITYNIGDEISDDINVYATFNGIDSSTCQIDLNNVDNTKTGDYEYTITCGSNVYKEMITILDSEEITVKTKNAYTSVNGTINAEDFISSTNKETCTYEFTEDTVITDMVVAEGTYTVKILVKCDDLETTIEASLQVISSEIEAFFYASEPSKEINGYEGTVVMTDSFAIDPNLQYIGISERTYVYTFTNEDEYNTVKTENENSDTFDGISGVLTFDEENKTLTVVAPLEASTLDLEYGSTFPTNYSTIKDYYVQKGYSTESR